ncbi:single-stranded-DNA-specific exonuclease RecJ [Alphaproteobacteria bacterium HT1-32]|nr:single-stranded-DNA-specific exonuclease RecJ [Alphaproteobacteria bacterium HT1-32]
MDGGGAFAGVSRSLTGRKWTFAPVDERLAIALSQRQSIPDVVGRVLAARGVGLDDASEYLDPRLRSLLPDPGSLIDMERAASRIVAAVRDGEQIAIFGDYDVDGATSSALLHRFLASVGGKVSVYIPDRVAEGYGPNTPALQRLQRDGAKVVITVDCGATAYEPLAAATAAGLDVLVVDHHAMEATTPDAYAVVNPNRLDETCREDLKLLAAVGVAFLMAIAVNRKLRDAGWYRDRPEPNLLNSLDIVALGTVCDVVPLTGLNRALVAQGLKVLAQRRNTGIAALADVAKLDQKPAAWHLGFLLGPRVNAGGRVGESGLGTRLLSSDNAAEAADLAGRLDAFNTERRMIEDEVLTQAIEQVDEGRGFGKRVVIAAGEGWHPGVIGIVASRLKDRYNRPACVIALDKGEGKGSGRSMSGFDLGAAVIAARQSGLLLGGGGHKMAAGFSVAESAIPELAGFLDERVEELLDGQELVPELRLDGILRPSACQTDLVDALAAMEPFGAGNPEPRFMLADVQIAYSKAVGQDQNHVSCRIQGQGGGPQISAIAFRAMETDIGPALLGRRPGALHMAGRVRADWWNGERRVQLMIDDVASSESA